MECLYTAFAIDLDKVYTRLNSALDFSGDPTESLGIAAEHTTIATVRGRSKPRTTGKRHLLYTYFPIAIRIEKLT